jgi:hypothetical protein
MGSSVPHIGQETLKIFSLIHEWNLLTAAILNFQV